MSKYSQISPGMYLIPQEGGMRVPGLVCATEALLAEADMDKPIDQVRNVAHLPGIVGYSIAMPDMHWGYGFPIGGVAATDKKTGVISPGGVGYDINCGVRLALAPFPFSKLSDHKQRQLLESLFHHIPSGVGHGHRDKALTEKDYSRLLLEGSAWSIGHGLGFKEDLEHSESGGVLLGADPSAVSRQAKERGAKQLGSIGSGNHFVEVGEVESILLPEIAENWGVYVGQTYLLIHTGSRGLGHQVCQDFLDRMLKEGYGKDLPDRQLVSAPIQSELGRHYLAAMAAAANFAFNNRQNVLHAARRAFHEVCGIAPQEIKLLYDVCHNIAKFETYSVDGVEKELCVHRKGATRAFGPGSKELPSRFVKTGQPVLVPGDMGRASYLLVGSGSCLTWCSACHGAGRARSRIASDKAWRGRNTLDYMKSQNVLVRASSGRTITEEMPDAYKDVEAVVDAVALAGLARKVARLKPRLVVKG